jgi:uncharacterized membrane protein (Fun14 family)
MTEVPSSFAPGIPGLGFGGAVGLAAGYVVKKFTSAVLMLAGLAVIALQVMAYLGWLSVDWSSMQAQVVGTWQSVASESTRDWAYRVLTANLPFAGAFGAGFAAGFKIG